MKKAVIIIALIVIWAATSTAQNPYLVLTYTAEDNGTYVQLDSIKIENRSQDCDTMLYWPDTVLILGSQIEIPESPERTNSFQLHQNFPNPVVDRTTISMYIPDKDVVNILITDLIGRIIYKSSRVLDKGYHSFIYQPGNSGMSVFSTSYQTEIQSVRVLCINNSKDSPKVDYSGYLPSKLPDLKSKSTSQDNFMFSFGDTLLNIGYYYHDHYESGIFNTPETHDTIVFQFANDIPCPGIPTVEYQGQVYNTVQIFNQCWLKENLNVGTMIPGSQNMKDDGIIEKYCYDDNPDNCIQYGGLYRWDEMMKYTLIEGCQGICPLGWHISTDEEWKLLEGTADTEYGIGDPIWDEEWERGSDGGTVLKSTSGWSNNGNGVDELGFTGLPGGLRVSSYSFSGMGGSGAFWSTSKNHYADKWVRGLDRYSHQIIRLAEGNSYAVSIRCLKNEETFPPITITFTAQYDTNYTRLDSIKVMNRIQNQEAILYWPDTILVLPDDLAFSMGDTLLYIGYRDTLESGILESPVTHDTSSFQFAHGIPCPSTPIVTYEGQVYNTIQIFSQCWLKENINVGLMIDSLEDMQDNGIIEKYCFGNSDDSCAKYGGLYQWDEMMQYVTLQGAQGICPSGWHIPSDEEWKVLEGSVDSQYGLGDPVWDIKWEYRGYDAGMNLKTTTAWKANGNGNDKFGFSGLPGGVRNSIGDFSHTGYHGSFWSSTTGIYEKWGRSLHSYYSAVNRVTNWENPGFSVRCIKD